jgi:hypothetical protein
MPLISYECYVTYPDGTPAANREQLICLLGGNVGVPLFTNKAGTVPLANPLTTDGDGLATFFAAPGSFITELAGDIFHFTVSASEPDDAWPGVFVHEQAVPAAVWTVNHHFGIEPSATVLVSDQVTEGDVTHPTSGQTVITFGAPVAGTAYLRS